MQKIFYYFAIALIQLGSSYVMACTGIVNKAQDDSWIYGRTMEFGADLVSFDLLFVPRGIKYQAQEDDSHRGSEWITNYAFVGFNPFGLPIVAEGVNEKGLACGSFYFPGWAEYENNEPTEKKEAISNLDFSAWVLGKFSSVAEVRQALPKTYVYGVFFKPWNLIPPLHYLIIDQSGDKVVIEYVKGKLFVYEMPLETITNSPAYEWHMLNARNYIGLKALNEPSIKIHGEEFAQFGQGSGALGLPGDFTPPSRFIRAAFLNQITLPAKNSLENVKRAFKILNQFDIPMGAVREKSADKEVFEQTQWTSVADLKNQKYYFHTYKSRQIQQVDLQALKLDSTKVQSIKIDLEEKFYNVTRNFD